MFRWLTLLLLLYFINYCGTSSRSVSGIKGGDVTLTCDFEDGEISHIDLNSLTKNILACQKEECTSENGRVFKTGSCDIIIKDLRLRDAGKYFLRLYYTNDQAEVKRETRMYQLHIQDEISVNTGEELKLDVLLTNADKVETNSSGEWTEVWTRGHGVSSDRLTDSDGNLTINAFTSTDTGTYRVLDPDGEILITLTLTESVGLDHPSHEYWLIGLFFFGALALVLIIMIYIRKCSAEGPFSRLWTQGDGNANVFSPAASAEQTSPIHGGPTSQLTGLKGSAANILVESIRDGSGDQHNIRT